MGNIRRSVLHWLLGIFCYCLPLPIVAHPCPWWAVHAHNLLDPQKLVSSSKKLKKIFKSLLSTDLPILPIYCHCPPLPIVAHPCPWWAVHAHNLFDPQNIVSSPKKSRKYQKSENLKFEIFLYFNHCPPLILFAQACPHFVWPQWSGFNPKR